MPPDESSTTPVPEWFVSFSDMMALLLTCFIMLVACSEARKDEKFNSVMEQVQRRFGKHPARLTLASGGVMPRQSAIARQIGDVRSWRQSLLAASTASIPANAITGAERAPAMIVEFAAFDTAALAPEAEAELDSLAAVLAAGQGKLEIRGIATPGAIDGRSDDAEEWSRAYERGRAVLRYLTDACGVADERVQLTVSAPPVAAENSAKDPITARVELYLREDVVSD